MSLEYLREDGLISLKYPIEIGFGLLSFLSFKISARKASVHMGISYPTVLKAFNVIRMAITADSPDESFLLCGEVEIDKTYFGARQKGKRGRGSKNKIPVFGILERKGTVKVEVLKNVTAEKYFPIL